MKLETFFEKFDLFADAPDAVAKMRELVMSSAFSGAFSDEPRDQPMPEDWAIEGAPTLPPIPSSWSWQRGTAVFDVIRGVSYKKGDASDSQVDGSFPILRANNIGRGVNFDELVYVPRDNIRDEQFVRRGDILIAMSSGSKKLVGKAAPIVTDFHGAFGAFCGVIRNKSKIPDAVLARYFESPQYTSWVTAAGRGIGINNLGKGDLDSLPVPTPPLAEQKRIVAKVDELMALCDRLEAQQQEREEQGSALARASLARFADAPTPANLQWIFHASFPIPPADLRKSILTLAVQGKLVPQDPNDEPAEDLLARIATSKSKLQGSGRIAKDKPVDPVDSENLPFEVPESWRWARLAELTELITKGSSPKWQGIAYVSESEGILFITSENVGNYRLRKLDDLKYVEARFNEIEPRSILKNGDLLMNLVGASIGRAAVYNLHDGANINQAVALIRLVSGAEGFLPSFLLHYFNSPFAIDYMLSSRVVNAQPNISLTNAREFAIPVPTLAEQRRIVAKVDELMALVNALETQLATARTTATAFLAAALAELTSGSADPQTTAIAA